MGQAGLARLIPERRLERIQRRVRKGGAFAMVVPALLPPPFPLTPFILACGALDVSQWRFLVTFGVGRLVRFGVASILAVRFGSGILDVLQSDTFRAVIIGFIVLAVAGTVVSAVVLWRKSRDGHPRPDRPA
jgi:membrane protein DedA with SNARE-associated domain